MGINKEVYFLMKKKVFIIFLLIFSIFNLHGAESQKDVYTLVKEDISYFKEILENGYVFYDELYKANPVKFNEKDILKKYKKLEKKLKKNTPEVNFVNGINQDALLSPLWYYLQDLKPNDGHLCIKTNSETWHLSNNISCFSSEYFFQREKDNFILIESPDKLLTGKKFTDDISNLKKVIKNNQEMYMFAPCSFDYRQNSASLSLDDKNYTIPVEMMNSSVEDNTFIKLTETSDSLYFKIKDFSIVSETSKEKEFLAALDTIPQKMNNKKYIILDLRSNLGGYIFYAKELTAAIYGKREIEAERELIRSFFKLAEAGDIELKSYITARGLYDAAMNSDQSQGIIKMNKEKLEEQKKSYPKYFDGFLTQIPEKMPSDYQNTISEKIIVLVDYYTISSAEECIGYLYFLDENNITLIGLNTGGSMIGGQTILYELPNSKLKIRFASISHSRTPLLNYIPAWKGENYGFYPDYWCDDKNIVSTVVALTGDKELEKVIVK